MSHPGYASIFNSYKMFTFCDVLHVLEAKQKQTLDRVQYGLEIIFKVENI